MRAEFTTLPGPWQALPASVTFGDSFPLGKAFLSPALRGDFFCAILEAGKVRCIVKMKKERLFTNRQLLTLLWPLIIEQMLEILVGMADTVMVS